LKAVHVNDSTDAFPRTVHNAEGHEHISATKLTNSDSSYYVLGQRRYCKNLLHLTEASEERRRLLCIKKCIKYIDTTAAQNDWHNLQLTGEIT
jgi:hypothetical protein